MWPIFKTELLIYQSKGKLDEKTFRLVKSVNIWDSKISKILVKDIFGNENSTFHSSP